jgi:phosphate transport system protein
VRNSYHDQLDLVTSGLIGMSRLAARLVQDATVAVVETDLQAAEQVISGDAGVNELYRSIDDQALGLLARQQPVASDLRTLVTALRIATDLERAGDYAVHIAKVARRRYPVAVVPEQVRGTVREMGQRAAGITAKAGDVIGQRDLGLAQQLLDDDAAVDALHRSLFAAVLDAQHPLPAEEIVDITLVGRYYERLADHAVAVSRAVGYLVTGQHTSLTA